MLTRELLFKVSSRAGYYQRIQEIDVEDLKGALTDWFDQWLAVIYIDWEELMYVGCDVRGFPDLDYQAYHWLAQTAERFDDRIYIVTSFLEGYWTMSKGAHTICHEVINYLIDCFEETEQVPKTGYKDSIACALHTVFDHEKLDPLVKRKIQAMLLKHLESLEIKTQCPERNPMIIVLRAWKQRISKNQ